VRKLRQKLERGSPSWHYIHTHFGIGYRFDPETVVGDEEIAGERAAPVNADGAGSTADEPATPAAAESPAAG
jgi:hypothetical protein